MGGEQLAVGYLNNEEKTAAAFIDSPYGRVYRTGDRAKLNTDGTLECLGRIVDGQVKLRGQRIELGEIEHAILRTEGCHAAAVRVIGSIIVAFCAVESTVTEDTIATTCEGWLPKYMMPGEMVLMEELPRLPSGKVNAGALQKDFEEKKSAIEEEDDIVENMEPELLQILREQFGTHVSSQTDMARAGLDSLTAIGLSSRLRQAGYDIKASVLLKTKTVGGIIPSIQKSEASDDDQDDPSCMRKLPEIQTPELESELSCREVEDILPCTSLQTAMLSETLRSAAAYWNTVDLEIATTKSVDAVLQAIHAIIQHNTILRTGFVQHNSTFYSVIFNDIHPRSITQSPAGEEKAREEATGTLLRPLRIYLKQENLAGAVKLRLLLHHAIYDGWSLDLLKSDLAKALGQESMPCRAQFRDVVSFFSSKMRQQYDDEAKVFWADYLFGWNKSPFPRLVPKIAKSHLIETRTLEFTLPDTNSRAYSGSAQVPFQSAFALVWGGVLGLQDVVLGSVTSGRTIPVKGIENVMGPCISSLPLRVNMGSMNTADDLVNSISSSNRRMMEHSTLSQLEIKKLAHIHGGEQLYDALFVYQESLEQRRNTESIVKEVAHMDHSETKLVLEVQPVGDVVVLQATFHSTHISSELADIILHQIAEMSSKIFRNPHTPLESICSLETSNSTYNMGLEKLCGVPPSENLARVVEEAVDSYPDRTAIAFATEISSGKFEPALITYTHLNRNANRIAHFLLSQNVRPGDVIPIVMNKSIRLYTAILGIIKAGCGYLPLLPSTPSARIIEIFTQSGSYLCLTEESCHRTIPPSVTVRTILIDEESMEEFPSHNPSVDIKADSPAYVIYTSGTTGTPKGVNVSQKNIASNVTYLGRLYPESHSRESKFLQACSQAFDVSVFEIFFAWHKGMCLCVAQNDALFADIEEAIRKFEITHLSLTPTIASLINPQNVPTVEFLVTAGEPMTNAVHERWNDLLWQGYGPSETTNICSVKKMSMDDYIEHLGFVFDNTSVVVLQPKSYSTLPIGWAGEFCFGGDQVAIGYLNMPRLTAEKFFDHPAYGRLYRSGDFGRMLPDGSLIILGRIDDQLKLRGQRIEAAEVNGIVSKVASATAAVTLVLKQANSIGELLVTFYARTESDGDFQVLSPNGSIQDQVFAQLHTQLLPYMVPSYLIPVSRIPLTSSGKVDKRAINWKFAQLSREYLQSVTHQVTRDDDGEWTEMETTVASILMHALHVAKQDIGRWTPLAVLGLDSISAIQTSKLLGEAFDTNVSISTVLQQPTVAQLAKTLQFRAPSKQNGTQQYFDETFLKSVHTDVADKGKRVIQILPCSPLQEAMISRGKTNYYNKSLLRLQVDPYEMRNHWQNMCRRHDILRTYFVSTTNANHPIAQVSLADWDLPWHEFNVTEPSLDAAVRDHLSRVPEPLDTGIPPLSLALIRYRSSNFLSFICHHALYDGVAMECLWREVEALARGEQLQPAASYAPFIHEIMNTPQDDENFWKSQFANFRPSLLLPKFNGKAMEQVTHTVTVHGSLHGAQDRIKSLGLSLLSACQATVARILAVVTNNSDVCFGNVMNGRTVGVEGIERLIAPCFNTVPIRQDISSYASNVELAKSLLALNIELLKHQFTPLRRVQKIAASETRLLFDTLLLVQQPLQEMDVNIWTLEEDSGVMDLPLVFEVTPCPNLNSLVLDLHYDMAEVPHDFVMGASELFKYLFQQILDSPHATTDRDNIPSTLLEDAHFPQLPWTDYETDEDELDATADGLSWSKEELDVRKTFSELSQVPAQNIEHTTSLFKLGLDSINAVQIAALLRQKNYSVSASDVIDCKNCLRIARRIIENGCEAPNVAEYDFTAFEAGMRPLIANPAACQVLPCTQMQCAMISAFVSSGGVNYLNEISLELQSGISQQMVEDKWTDLTGIHAMLRTGFAPVRHADCSYVMLQYDSFPGNRTISCLSNEFDHSTWKVDTAKDVLANLHLPPWRLALAEDGRGVTMHLAVHHALYDATSLQLILSNFSQLLTGRPTQPAANIHSGLSTVIKRSSGSLDAASSFWRQMGEQATVNRFPILTPLRELQREILIEERPSVLSNSDLRQLAKTRGVSVQAVILAAWTRILACYTGEEAVVFGVTLSGRTCESTIATPLPCLTTVPVVAQNSGSNRDLLDQVMALMSEMHQHQFLPLSRIQKELGHPATAVFDTLVAYQNIEGHPDGRPWIQRQDDGVVEFPVSLEVEPLGEATRLRLTYFNDILPPKQAELLLRQFDATMEDLLKNPDGQQSDLHKYQPDIFAISPPLEPTMSAPVQLLHQFVEMQAQINPDKIALEHVSGFNGTEPIRDQWTFAEFNAMGNKVANMLSRRTKAGNIIAIHFDKCPEAYFSILGILKSGSAFVALDFNAPSARKEFILKDSQAPCLLTSCDSTIDFELTCPVIVVDDDLLQPYPDTPCEINGALTPDTTCYCLYTSGTTGTPKGCEITHENTVQCMMAFQDLFRGHWSDDSRWLQFAALHFDVSVLEQYWSWSVGVAVVAAKKDLILDDLIGFINNANITHIDLTPSLARLTHPDTVPSLCRGVFITGGEQLKQEILDAWGSKAVIYNAYGPTEATIGVTTYQRVPQNGRPSNIGPQFRNVGSYVFHKDTEIPVFRGAVGELCVSGKLVGKGYLNRPELTTEKFPTLEKFGERIYRTGDLVRILHDGCFEFLGRSDDQVKLRGQRLELGEIDHVIRSVEGIHDVATIVTKHSSSGKDVLVSFIVGSRTNGEPLQVLEDNDGLGTVAREMCRDKLPGYMVPSYFLRLPYIPLSPNNKAEGKQLKKIFSELSQEELVKLGSATLSRNLDSESPTYQKLLRLLSEFCNTDRALFSESASVFDFGVDSITALQLASFLRNEGFSAASPALILRNPVVADLVSALSTGVSDDTNAILKQTRQNMQAFQHRYRTLVCRELSISPSEIEYIYPCSALQQGMLAKTAVDGDGAYFNTFRLGLKPEASMERLKAAFESLFATESVLRTCFIHTQDGYIQASHRGTPLTWESQHLSEAENISDLINSIRQKWIDASKNQMHQPFKVTEILAGDSRTLLVQVFHALYDGTSFDLMMQKLDSLYNNTQTDERPSFLDALEHGPLRDHGASQNDWLGHLKGWSASTISLSGEEKSTASISASRRFNLEEFEQIRSRNGVTMQSVLLAAWSVVLQQYSARAVATGVIVSGRSINLPGVERTIGPLFNTLPFFSNIAYGLTWKALLKRCQDFNALALEDPHVPLQQIQKWTSSGNALFDSLFAYQIEPAFLSEDVPWEIEDGGLNPDYPLALEATKRQDGTMQLLLVAKEGVTNQARLNQLLEEFEAVVKSMGTEENAPVQKMLDVGCDTTVQPDEAAASFDTFSWGPTSDALRREISLLSNVPEVEIQPTTTWLELGLDSIDAVQLSARLKKQNLMLSPSAIMKGRSVAYMANSLTSLSNTPEHDTNKAVTEMTDRLWQYVEASGVAMAEVAEVLPTTPLQDTMVAGMLQSDFTWYFNHEILEVAPGIDSDKLKAAWSQLFEAAPILRTGFVEISDPEATAIYSQVIYKTSPRIETVSIKSTNEFKDVTAANATRAVKGAARENLACVVRVVLDAREFYVLSISHALYDGWSLGLIHEDLRSAYNDNIKIRPTPDNFLLKSSLSLTQEAEEFWANYLDGVPSTVIGEGARQASAPARKERNSAVPLADINSFCRQYQISLQSLCQACWAIILARRTQSLDVVFGAILSGRDFAEAEDLMFPTMNTVAIRCILHGSISSFLQYMEHNITELRTYQMFPLRKAKAAANIPGKELFDSLFLLQKSPATNASQTLFKSVDGSASVDYPVCAEAAVNESALEWTVACQNQSDDDKLALDLITELDSTLKYVLSNADNDLVAFAPDGAQIAGSQPITLATDDIILQAKENVELKYEWDATSKTLRSVLSRVSNIPEDSINASSNLYHLGLDSITAIKVSTLLKMEGIHLRPTELVRAASIAQMAEQAKSVNGFEASESVAGWKSWTTPSDIDTDAILQDNGITQQDVEILLPALPMQVYMMSTWQNTQGELFYPEFRYLFSGPQSATDISQAWTLLTTQFPLLRTCLLATESQDMPYLQVVLKPEASSSLQPFVHLEIQPGATELQKIVCLRIHHALYDGISLPATMDALLTILQGSDNASPEIHGWADMAVSSTTATQKQTNKEFWTTYLQGHQGSAASTCTSRARTSFFREAVYPHITSLGEIASRNGISVQSLIFAAYATIFTPKEEDSVVFAVYLANRSDDDIPTTLPTLNLVPIRVRKSAHPSMIDMAKAIQADLREITAHGREKVGLWEIARWTEVTVDRFVNFLTLPDATQGDVATNAPTIEALPTSDIDKTEAVASHTTTPPMTMKNPVGQYYPVCCARTLLTFRIYANYLQDSIDVEFAIRNGHLDVGVFGLQALVTDEDSENLVRDLINILDTSSLHH